MARMNALIPLMYEPANPIAAMAQGQETRARQGEFRAQEGLRNALTQYGAGAMQGQPEALNALAAYSPEMAFNLQSGIAGERRADEALELDRQNTQSAIEARRSQAAREAQAWTAGVAAEEAARAAAETERLGRRLYMAYQQGPEAWDRANDGTDFDAVPFDDAPMALAEIDGLWSVLSESMKPEKDPESFRALEMRADAAGLTEGSAERAQFMAQGGTPSGMAIQMTPDGGVSFAQGPGVRAGVFTEAQSKDNVYATRARGALPTVAEYGNALTSRADVVAGAVPLGLGRGFQGTQYQVAEQAGNEFLTAVLRKDTGAAITNEEQRIYGDLYLPRPGDRPETLAYKAQARERAVAAIEAGMSPAQLLAQEAAIKNSGGNAPPDLGPGASDAPPPGVSPDEWNLLTPEERALWQN
jgi:hypothetical protein